MTENEVEEHLSYTGKNYICSDGREGALTSLSCPCVPKEGICRIDIKKSNDTCCIPDESDKQKESCQPVYFSLTEFLLEKTSIHERGI